MKNALPKILFVLVIFTSCVQDKESKAKLDELTAQINTETQNKAVVQKYLDGLNKNDTAMYSELFAQVFSPEVRLYAPAGNTTFLNYADNMKMQKSNYIGFPDAHWEIVDIAAEGNKVFARLWTTATQTGVFNGLQPSGKKIEFSNTVTFKLENGKIIEQREDFDQLSIMQQLGFELLPKAEKK